MFIVLRKKPLIFLHWYHHAVALVYVWHAGAFCNYSIFWDFRWRVKFFFNSGKEGVAAGRVLAIMNCCIHFLMYSYYALSAGKDNSSICHSSKKWLEKMMRWAIIIISGGIRIPRVIAGSISMLQISEMFAAVAVSCIVLVCKLQGRVSAAHS